MWHQGCPMFIIHLNLPERLFGTQLSNVAIPIMYPVGKCISNTISKEIIQFVAFVLSAILTYLFVKACKHCVMVPTLKHSLNRDNAHQSHLTSCIPHIGREGSKTDIRFIGCSEAWKMNNTKISNGTFHGETNLKGILTGLGVISEDIIADRTVKLFPSWNGIDHLLAHAMAVNGFLGTW